MKKPYSILVALFFCLACLTAFKRAEDPVERIVNILDKLLKDNPVEKVHLSFDKPYYATGDTIWFRASVLVGNAHKLSALSGVVYAEFLNQTDSVIYRHRLPLFAGVAKGNFVLSEDIKAGAYRVRAYTQWMRNSSDEYFFDKTIQVGSYRPQSIASKISYEYAENGTAASILYTHEGKPFSDKKIEYNIKATDGQIFKGRGKTDPNGVLKIVFDQKKFSGKTSRIQTVIDMGGDRQSIHNFPIKIQNIQPDLQFFPEGGSLVQGIASRIAFKCIDREGRGTQVTGTVYDSQGNEVTKFRTSHAGMGMFKMLPEDKKSYYAKVTFADSTTMKINLPPVSQTGLVLSVYNTVNPDTILLRVSANASVFESGGKDVNLIGQSGGSVCFTSKLDLNQPVNAFKLPKSVFPSGIAQFTLLTSSGEPLNERIIFIWNNDQLNLQCNSDKKQYSKQEKVKFNLKALAAEAPTIGSFSVSVINESLVPANEADESNIISNILLTSDLKGYIENPNYYFNDKNQDRVQALDLLMMTQGYRRFVWKEILSGQKQPGPVFKPEKIATVVSGTLMNLGNKPIAGGKITLLANRAGLLMDTITDANGNFSFPTMLLKDSVKVTVQGRTAKEGDKVKLNLDRVPGIEVRYNKNMADVNYNVNDSLKNFLAASKQEFDNLKSKGLLNQNFTLKDVVISSKKASIPYTSNLMGPGHADQEIKGEDAHLEACGNLLLCLVGRLAGVSLSSEGILYLSRNSSQLPLLLVVNGQQFESGDVGYSGILEGGDINPSDILSIELLKSPGYTAVYGPKGSGGVLIINLKPGSFRNVRDAYGIITFQHKGFYKARDFYTPKYNVSATHTFTAPRTTVYWNPVVVTGTDGTATVEFYNENEGQYRVLVEGVNGDGQLGRQVYKYTVR